MRVTDDVWGGEAGAAGSRGLSNAGEAELIQALTLLMASWAASAVSKCTNP